MVYADTKVDFNHGCTRILRHICPVNHSYIILTKTESGVWSSGNNMTHLFT